jgi:hypothetical protein
MTVDTAVDYLLRPLSAHRFSRGVKAAANDALPLWTFDKKLANQSPNTKLLPS